MPVYQPATAVSWPYDQWPIAFRVLACQSHPSDTGLGDVIERQIGPIGSTTYENWTQRIRISVRRCPTNLENWNLFYPLPGRTSPPDAINV